MGFKIDLTSDGNVESNPGPQSNPNSDPLSTRLSLSSLGTEPAHKKKTELSESPLQFLEAEELYFFLDIESLSAKELHTVKLPKTSEKKDAADDELDSEAKPISELSEEPDELKPDFENDSIIQIGIQLVNTFEHPLQESRSFLLTSKPVLTDDLNAEVLHFENEKEMLVEFIHLLKLEKPKLICGYNLNSFDLPFIIRRCQLLDVEINFLIKLGEGSVCCPWFFQRWAKKSNLASIWSLDLYQLLRSTYTFPGGRSLENVVSYLFEGSRVQKLDLLSEDEKLRLTTKYKSQGYEVLRNQTTLAKLKEIERLWNGSDEDRTSLACYCINDVELCRHLVDFFLDKKLQTMLFLPAVKSVKCDLRQILKDPNPQNQQSDLNEFRRIGKNFSRINTRGRMLLKLFFIDEYDRQINEKPHELPNLDILQEKTRF
ncbi:hypothetical protein GEMRC1_011931 [Eukaryota sp. GEM-RC1]